MDVAQLQHISDGAIDAAGPTLREANLELHSHPEIKFQEHHAHKVLTDFLEKRGFEVTRGAFGLDTAFKANFGPTTGRAVVINLEYDALEVIGHACGHNLIATAGLSAVVGIAEALKQGAINGRVVAMGTPAEEGGGGKIKMIRAGAYEDAFCCLMVHPIKSINNAYSTSMCGSELTIEYIGKPAHAMVAPHEGINALDAMTLFHTSIGLLRQHILPTDRIRGVVLEAGEQSGVIPAYSKAMYCVRSASLERYKVLKQRFINCLEAAALATGCELKTTWLPAYWDIRPNEALARSFASNADRRVPEGDRSMIYGSEGEQKSKQVCYSTDMGNVTYVVPSIHPLFAVATPGGDIHTEDFTKAAGLDDAHGRAVLQGKAMAATAIEVLANDEFAEEVKREFESLDLSIAEDPTVA